MPVLRSLRSVVISGGGDGFCAQTRHHRTDRTVFVRQIVPLRRRSTIRGSRPPRLPIYATSRKAKPFNLSDQSGDAMKLSRAPVL
jgi:hypothetical protein